MPPSIIQLQRELEDFPDEKLIQEAQQPTEYPAFLSTQELKRRASLREKYQARESQVPQGTVAERQVEQAMQNLAPMGPMAGPQPPGMPPQGGPPQGGPPQGGPPPGMPPQGGPPQGMPPQGGPPPMAYGGLVGLQGGGPPFGIPDQYGFSSDIMENIIGPRPGQIRGRGGLSADELRDLKGIYQDLDEGSWIKKTDRSWDEMRDLKARYDADVKKKVSRGRPRMGAGKLVKGLGGLALGLEMMMTPERLGSGETPEPGRTAEERKALMELAGASMDEARSFGMASIERPRSFSDVLHGRASGGIVGLQNGGKTDWWLPKPGQFGEYEDFLARQQAIEEALRWREEDLPRQRYEEYRERMGPYGQMDEILGQFERTQSFEDWMDSPRRSFAPSPFSMEALSGWNPSQRELRGIGSEAEFDFVRENEPKYGIEQARALWQEHHGDEAVSRFETGRGRRGEGQGGWDIDEITETPAFQDWRENRDPLPSVVEEALIPAPSTPAGFDIEDHPIAAERMGRIDDHEEWLRKPTDAEVAYEDFLGGIAEQYRGRIPSDEQNLARERSEILDSLIAGFGGTGTGGFSKAFREAGGTKDVWLERDRQKAEREKYEDAADEILAKRHGIQTIRSRQNVAEKADAILSDLQRELEAGKRAGLAAGAAIQSAYQQVVAANLYRDPRQYDALQQQMYKLMVDGEMSEQIYNQLQSWMVRDMVQGMRGGIDPGVTETTRTPMVGLSQTGSNVGTTGT